MLSTDKLLAHLLHKYGSLIKALSYAEKHNDGICYNCGHIQDSVDPKKLGVPCTKCKKNAVYELSSVIIRPS